MKPEHVFFYGNHMYCEPQETNETDGRGGGHKMPKEVAVYGDRISELTETM